MAAPAFPFDAKSVSFALQLAFIAVASLAAYSFVRVAQEGETHRVCGAACALHPDYLAADRKAPLFSLKDMGQKTVSLESFRGKTVVLNFWSKTCRPCLEEMPELELLAEQFRGRKDVALLTMTEDERPEDILPTLRQVFRDGHVPFPVLFDPDGEVIGGKYGTHLFPETWVIDPNGIIRARFDGAREWSAGMVTSFVNEIARGDYCPIVMDKKQDPGLGERTCDALMGM